jgi:hypothetical protein
MVAVEVKGRKGFFLKKEPKTFFSALAVSDVRSCGTPKAKAKVFCFFFSRKKSFPLLSFGFTNAR